MKKYLFILGIAAFLTSCDSQKAATTEETSKEVVEEKVMEEKKEVGGIPIDASVKKGTLSNGLTYYIKNNGKPENKVELRLVVNAGSILEDEDQRGVAHFLEHMVFNGTKNFKKNDLIDYLESIGVKFGAHLNAYTSFDETVYILPIPSDDPEKLEKGFQILEDWAHNALLNEEDIDDERGIVLEELRVRSNANMRMLRQYIDKVLYGSMYADRFPIGTKESIKTFTYESIRRFYNDWYRPDLMAVVAVGDVDVATLEAKIKSHFEKIPAVENPRPRKEFEVKNHDETFISIVSDKEAARSQAQIYFNDFGTPKKIETADDYRTSLVKGLFTQMINNRLDELRNSENPPFIFGYSFHGGTGARNKEAYQSVGFSSADGQLKALSALLEENERVRKFGFTDGELKRAKKDLMARMEKAYKDKDKTESARMTREFVNNFLTGEIIPGIEWEYKASERFLPTIQLDEVNKIILNYLRDKNIAIVLTGPEKEGLTQVTEEEVKALLSEVKTREIKPYEDKEVGESLITEMPTMGSIANASKDEKLGTITLVLGNGATVTLKKTDFKNDEVLFEAFSYGGTSLYSDAEVKQIGFAGGGLTEAGINGFNKVDMGKMMSGKIVRVRPFIGAYSEGFRGSSTPKDLETLFQMTHLYFTKLNKDDKAYASFINKQKGFLANMLSNPQTYFSNEMGKMLNDGNPRYLGFPDVAAMDNSDYDLAYKKYQERFANAGDFNFYFVGNVDERKFVEYVLKYIASLPGTPEKEAYKVHDFRPLTGSHKKVVEKGQDPKSSVRILFQGATTYDAKEARALRSLGEILTIKLIEKLREDEAGVYGASARGSISQTPYGWYRFSIGFPCGPENVEKLKDAALAELQKIIDNGPEEKDVNKVKEAQLIEHKEGLKENKFWLAYLKNSDYHKRDNQRVFNTEQNIEALSAKDIHDVAKKYVSGGYILGIHNPEK